MTWDFVYVEVSHVIENETHVPFLYRKRHSQKMQMTLHYYKTGIVRHYTYSYSFHIKSAPVTGEKPHLKVFLTQSCFPTWTYCELLLRHLNIDNLKKVFLKCVDMLPKLTHLKKTTKNIFLKVRCNNASRSTR